MGLTKKLVRLGGSAAAAWCGGGGGVVWCGGGGVVAAAVVVWWCMSQLSSTQPSILSSVFHASLSSLISFFWK